MSLVRRWVSRPAQRPTWLSNPSAPMTTFAWTSNVSPMCSHRAPTTRPSSRRSATALVLIMISEPAFAASRARNRSNRSRSKMYPHSFPARVSSRTSVVPSGAMIRAPSTSWQMNSRLGASPISSSHRFATPSPHRTGVPISDRFSIKRTSAPPRAAYFAAVLPVGPAPTTSTSIWWSIRVGPIPSDFMRIWESLFSNARCGGPQGPLSSGLRRSAVMLAPSRTAYVFVCVSTYTAHGAGNPEGPETRVLESRGLHPKRLGVVQRHSAGCTREPGDGGRREPSRTGRPPRGVPRGGRGHDRCGRMERARGADADDHRQLHRRLQHDSPPEPGRTLPEPVARNPRGRPGPHGPDDRQSGSQVRDDRELRRADALSHRWAPPTAALSDVPHGEARARRDLRRREGKHRGSRANGARSGSPVLARRTTAAPRGPEPNNLRTDRGDGAAAPPRRSGRHGRPGERGRPVGRTRRRGRSVPEAEPTDPPGIREDDRQPQGENRGGDRAHDDRVLCERPGEGE